MTLTKELDLDILPLDLHAKSLVYASLRSDVRVVTDTQTDDVKTITPYTSQTWDAITIRFRLLIVWLKMMNLWQHLLSRNTLRSEWLSRTHFPPISPASLLLMLVDPVLYKPMPMPCWKLWRLSLWLNPAWAWQGRDDVWPSMIMPCLPCSRHQTMLLTTDTISGYITGPIQYSNTQKKRIKGPLEQLQLEELLEKENWKIASSWLQMINGPPDD